MCPWTYRAQSRYHEISSGSPRFSSAASCSLRSSTDVACSTNEDVVSAPDEGCMEFLSVDTAGAVLRGVLALLSRRCRPLRRLSRMRSRVRLRPGLLPVLLRGFRLG